MFRLCQEEAGFGADKELILGVKVQRKEQDDVARIVMQTQMPMEPGGTRTLSACAQRAPVWYGRAGGAPLSDAPGRDRLKVV